jgi:hypothetical protein
MESKKGKDKRKKKREKKRMKKKKLFFDCITYLF